MSIGIYKIINPKGKIYIGQSTNIENRKHQYKSLYCKLQPKLYNSLQKHGWEQHMFEIIEECSLDQLNERETYWKQYYLNQFEENWEMVLFCEIYDNGGGPKSEETRKKMSEGLEKAYKTGLRFASWEGKKRPDHSNFLKENKSGFSYKRTEQHKENNRITTKKMWEKYDKKDLGLKISKGKKGYIMSEDSKKKMSESKKKNILQFDKNNNLIKEWFSLTEASKELNINIGGISQALNGKQKTAGNFIWKYK